jgi:hypothetical protein
VTLFKFLGLWSFKAFLNNCILSIKENETLAMLGTPFRINLPLKAFSEMKTIETIKTTKITRLLTLKFILCEEYFKHF